ncbi:MAG TPA: hypothetical protein VGG73_13355 [Vicinamibacterales bacterium]
MTDRQPETVAAYVNAILVLLVPVGVAIAIPIGMWFSPSNTTTVHATPTPLPEEVLVYVAGVMLFVVLFLPLAAIAGWRTRVHARRYLDFEGGGWQGVLEAGVVGLFIAIWILRRGIATRPADAPPYVIAYGGAAAVIGLTIGLILRTAAVLTLKLTSRDEASRAG